MTDVCKGGELFEKIIEQGFFNENVAAYIMKQILSAVFYCHSNKIVHRDLKPENILLNGDDLNSGIKIIDFGTSRVYKPGYKMTQRFGTPYYVAPEVIDQKYTEKCDIWSCGVICYILLAGTPPFNGKNDAEIVENVQAGEFDLTSSVWDSVSDVAKDFIKKLLEMDPSKRYSAVDAL